MEQSKEPHSRVLRVEVLEELVEELMKATPEEGRVKDFMRQTGIPYADDPIERINRVLRALHDIEPV